MAQEFLDGLAIGALLGLNLMGIVLLYVLWKSRRRNGGGPKRH
jgi:hypothetical protein